MTAEPSWTTALSEADAASRHLRTTALGLEPVCERGERLSLLPEDLGEFEVRGSAGPSEGNARSLYCVVRPGWRLDGSLLLRALLEAISGVRG